MQALDLLHRRLGRDGGRGLQAFLTLARDEITHAETAAGASLVSTLELLEASAARLRGASDADASAYAFLRLATLAAAGWIALRLTRGAGRQAAAGRAWLAGLDAKARLESAEIALGRGRLSVFEDLRRA